MPLLLPDMQCTPAVLSTTAFSQQSDSLQAVIQGFPDDFHLGTLPSLLSAVGRLQPGVKIHAVLSSLLDRLAR